MTNDELVFRVARLVTPWAFDLTPAHYRLDRPEHFKETRAYAAQEIAKDTARSIISTIYEALQEPDEGMIRAFYYRSQDKPDAESAWNAMLTASPLNGGK